jgi:hypothetical protein
MIFLWFYINFTRLRLLTLDLKMSFCSKAPRSKTKITIGSPAAEQGWPAARDGRTPASERLGWGFELTLGHLVGLVQPEAAPATVGSEGGGGRLRRPQCWWAGGSFGQCTCMAGSKGCGWRPLRRLNLSRGGAQWGAPASSNRWRRRARRGSSELRPSNCEAGGVHGASGGSNGAHAR